MLRLRVFDSEGRQVQEVLVPEEGLVVGRGDECGLCLPEKAVSRRHARLYFHEGELVVEDEGSANGVYVEGVRADGPTIVEVGQRMRIGTFGVLVDDDSKEPEPEDAEPSEVSATPIATSPESAAPYTPQLVARDGPYKGERFLLNEGETTVGRVPGNDVILDDASVSRRHAKLVRNEGTFTLFDLRSSNGTRVNGSKISRTELKDGDAILFGDIPVVFTTSAGDTSMVDGRRRASGRRVRLAVMAGVLVLVATVVVVGIILKPDPPPPPVSPEVLLEQQRLQTRADLDRGAEGLRQGDFLMAEGAFRAVLQRDPINAEANAGLVRVAGERTNQRTFDQAEGIFQTRRELERARSLYLSVPEDSVFHARATDRLRELTKALAEQSRDQGLDQCRVRAWHLCQERLCAFFQGWPHDEQPPDGERIRSELLRAEAQLRRQPDFQPCALPEGVTSSEREALAVALTERYPDVNIRNVVVEYAEADMVEAKELVRRLQNTRSYRERLPEIERLQSKLDIVDGQASDVFRQIQAGDLESAESSFRTLVDADSSLLPDGMPHAFRDEVSRQIGDAFFEKGTAAQATGDFRSTYQWWSRGKLIAPDNARLVRGLFDLRQRAMAACASGATAASQGDMARARSDYELCRDISEEDTDVHRQALRDLTALGQQ